MFGFNNAGTIAFSIPFPVESFDRATGRLSMAGRICPRNQERYIQAMWSGLLASSTSPDGRSDENLIFMNLLKQLSSLEVSILRFAVEKAPKHVSHHGLIYSQQLTRIPLHELPKLFGIEDLQRIDRELDHLRELGLIGWGGIDSGGINASSGLTNLTPSSLALHLYVRAQGSKLSPPAYWNLASSADENTARKQPQ